METAVTSLPVLIAIGIALAALGLGIGIMMGRGMSPGNQKYRETERKLDQVLQDKKAYEDDVVEHFSETARLLNNLTDSYREVHNQLAVGAAGLCKEQGPISLGSFSGTDDAEIPADLAAVQPPLDYAPKSSPDEKGMLNEEFGLDRDPNAPPKEKKPAAEPEA